MKVNSWYIGAIAYGAVVMYLDPFRTFLGGLPRSATSIFLIALLSPIILLFSAGAKSNMNTDQNVTNDHWLLRLWKGQISLPLASIGYNVMGALFFTVMLHFVFFKLGHASFNLRGLQLTILTGVFFAYHMVSTTGTIRSIRCYEGKRMWVVAARIGLVLSTAVFVIGFAFALLGENMFST